MPQAKREGTKQKPKTQEQAFQEGKGHCQRTHAGDRQGFNGCMSDLTRRISAKGRKKDLPTKKIKQGPKY